MNQESIELKRVADSLEKIEHTLMLIQLTLAEGVNRMPVNFSQVTYLPYQPAGTVLPSK